jgi:hypothetical protein
MTRWGVVLGGCCAAGLVLLAGCGTGVTGAAAADPAVVARVARPIGAQDVFGAAATVNPCSIVDVNDATAVRDVEYLPADALDDCALDVVLDDGTDTYVDVGPLESTVLDQIPMTDLSLVQSLPGGMALRMDNDPSDGFCETYLVFPDGFDLTVSASDSKSDSTTEACVSAKAMARDAAGQIEAGALRHLTYPAGSVALLNPCRLLARADIVHLLPNSMATPYPEGHECQWLPGPGDSRSWLTVTFPVGELDVSDPKTDKRVVIADRPPVTKSYEYSGVPGCDVTTALGRVPDGKEGQDNTDEAQLVEIGLELDPGSTADACATVSALAAAAWPTLPHTH